MTEQRRLALITGASKGIGFELAKVFAKNDYDLIIASSSTKIHDAARILRQYEVDVKEVEADLATKEGVDMLYDIIRTYGHPLDAAALNAGVGVGGEFVKTDFQDELNLINLNVVNLVYLAKLLIRDMSERNEGRMLITSSVAAEMPGPYYAVYAASKAFVQSFAEAIRYEMKDTHRNVIVTSLQPGPTDTEFFERAHLMDTKAGQGDKDDPAKVAEQGFSALMNGDDHVVAGSMMNRVQAMASRFMSEEQGAKAQGSSLKPNSLH